MIGSLHRSDEGNGQGHRPQHVGVDPQVNAGRFETPMSEQIANGLDTDAAAQQSHGEGMPQRVRRCPVDGEAAPRRPIAEDLDDAVVLETGCGPAGTAVASHWTGVQGRVSSERFRHEMSQFRLIVPSSARLRELAGRNWAKQPRCFPAR